MRVLAARGVEEEASIPFAGLLELLRPVLGHLDSLPAPQAAALRSALALGPAVSSDRLAIGAATLGLLAAAAEDWPLCVLVDDAQWLDEPSAEAVLFAARRLLADPVAIIVAVRTGEASPLADAGLPALELRGLDLDASEALLALERGGPVPDGSAERLFRATGGNPLALIELAGEAEAVAGSLVEAPLPIATTVERAFAGAHRAPLGAGSALAAPRRSGLDTPISACSRRQPAARDRHRRAAGGRGSGADRDRRRPRPLPAPTRPLCGAQRRRPRGAARGARRAGPVR